MYEATPSNGPRVRALKVRVYADGEYRSQVLHWERAIQAQLERASEAVEAPLGVRFEVESTRDWDRAPMENLERAMEQLEALDKGVDVDLVVGLLTALPMVTSTQHQLGYARILGRHCVIRGMDNVREYEALRNAFQHLPEAELEDLYRQRRQHKETSVFLHEWAHTLGAFHVADSHWMMYPVYDPAQGSFTPQSIELLSLSLRHLPQARRDRAEQRAWAQDLRAFLLRTVSREWEGPEKQSVLQWTERVVAVGTAPAPASAIPLSVADAVDLKDAMALAREGHHELADQRLAPLVTRYPLDENVQDLACYLGLKLSPTLTATSERCEAALVLFPNDVALMASAAVVRLQHRRFDEALSLIRRIREDLESRQDVSPEHWAALAGLSHDASCVTWAEQAARKAQGDPAAAQIQTWVAQVRSWWALPADVARSRVNIESEADVIRTAVDIDAHLAAGQVDVARNEWAALAEVYPQAPIVQILDCAVKARARLFGPARAACRRALAADDAASQAYFLLGWMAAATGAGLEARSDFERALSLAPWHEQSWQFLAQVYRRAGESRELKTLRARYETQFGRPLK
jgi:tetratricopeptide (TPR) repeat protein